MSLRKLCCMFAVGVFMMLLSVTAASACTDDHSSVSAEHVRNHHQVRSSIISSTSTVEHKHIASKDRLAKQPKSPIRASAMMTAVLDDDDPETEGGCIHANGCTCSGLKSHKTKCGTNGDCTSHPGLICTWGSGGS